MVSQIESIKKCWGVFLIVLLMLVVTWRGERGSFITIFSPSVAGNPDRRLWVENVIAKYEVPAQKSYIICIPKKDSGYAFYLCQYILYSTQVSSRIITEENQLDDAMEYDYIFIYDSENKIIKDWVSKNYPEQINQDIIVVEK